MEQPIKMELKVEKQEPRDEDAPTPLRDRAEESPRASGPDMSMSGCGWDSDADDGVHLSKPPTPGGHAIEEAIKEEFKRDPDQQLLDDILVDFGNRPRVKQEVCLSPPPPPCFTPPPPLLSTAPPLPSSSRPPPPLPSSSRPPPPPPSSPPLKTAPDGIPSAYTARDNLDDMDLCSLGEAESDADLMAEKMEILRKLAAVTGVDEDGSGDQKKKKKSKKRKRSRRSNKDKDDEEAESQKRSKTSSSPDEKENKRSSDRHWAGHRIKTEKPELDYVPVRADEKRLRVVKASNLLGTQPPQVVPRKENLSIQDKRNLGLARAQMALQLFQKKANKEDELEALMVDTMCKLPVHESFRNQNSFENPSPLCNNMNVVYEFNSAPGTRIDLAKWGLEVLPRPIRELCRILGIDIHRLKELQRTATPSQRILKLKLEQMEQGVGSEEADAGKATLHKTVGTQTDLKTSTHDAGIQARLEAPLEDSCFWHNPGFNRAELTQQQSNVMFTLQELVRKSPDPAWAERVYRALGPALATSRCAARQ